MLDADSQAFLDRLRAAAPPVPSPPDARTMRLAEAASVPPNDAARAALDGVEDRDIPGPGGALPIRLYRPRTPSGGVLVYFHGGGFVLGSPDTHDNICCALAAQSGALVVSVGYRLAPEHRYPAALMDAEAATDWVAAHAAALGADPARLAVAGDSAGGNLAGNVTLMARDKGGPAIAFQLLLYPSTHRRTRVPSEKEFGQGYFLTSGLIAWFRQQYEPERDPGYRYGAPFDAPDHHGLPPALIITAGCDPLRDQGAEYADKLRAAGVPVEYACYQGTLHGFISFADQIGQGRQALARAGQAVREALAPRP